MLLSKTDIFHLFKWNFDMCTLNRQEGKFFSCVRACTGHVHPFCFSLGSCMGFGDSVLSVPAGMVCSCSLPPPTLVAFPWSAEFPVTLPARSSFGGWSCWYWVDKDHFLVELSGHGLAPTLACDSACLPSQLSIGNVCLISEQGRKSRGDFT